MKILMLATAAGMVTGAVAAYAAADATIRQKGKVFSQAEISIKKGDELTFLNDDNIAHNVMSTTADNNPFLSPNSRYNTGAPTPTASQTARVEMSR